MGLVDTAIDINNKIINCNILHVYNILNLHSFLCQVTLVCTVTPGTLFKPSIMYSTGKSALVSSKLRYLPVLVQNSRKYGKLGARAAIHSVTVRRLFVLLYQS